MKKALLIMALGLGLTAFAQQTPTKKHADTKMEKMSPEELQQKRLKKLTKELSLDAKQQEQVGILISENGTKMRDLMAQMQAEKKDYEDKMKAVLTADQYQKWQKMKEETKEKMMEKRGKK